MTLLSDKSIRRRTSWDFPEHRRIIIEDCDLQRDLNPCSVSIYLGHTMKVWTGPLMDPSRDNSEFWKPLPLVAHPFDDTRGVWRLLVGHFYLGVMLQRITLPRDIAGSLTGNSSEARCGIVIHQQAGHFDPGYSGNGTFEFTVDAATTLLWPGMRIGQFLFQLVDDEVESPYNGRYQGDTDAQPARLHK